MSESQNIEYKQSWHDDYLKWVCGFANAVGGIIYIGKDDEGNTLHLIDYKRLLEEIPNKIRNALGIICDVQLLDESGKKYISIKVNPYSVAVSLRGRYYYRSGSIKLELTGVELNEFLLKKAGKTRDDVVEEGATIKDIDEKSIAKFIEDSKEKGRMPDTKGLTTLQILEKLQLTDGRKLKRAALILFGKNPNQFYNNIQVKIGRFGKDSTDLRFQEVEEGNMVQMLEAVQIQLNYKFLTRPITFEGLQRVERSEYPVDALREILLNALVHRTYMGSAVQMRVYDNRLSIWNEGSLPIGLNLEDLKVEHNSRPRNPKIAEACFKAGYIDAWGRGISKIYNACRDLALPLPEIREMNGGIEVTIFKKQEEAQNSERIRKEFGKNSERIRKEFGKNSERIRKEFGKEIASTLEIIKNQPNITASKIGETIGKTPRTVEKYLSKLREAGIIIRIGPKLGGHWEIMDK